VTGFSSRRCLQCNKCKYSQESQAIVDWSGCEWFPGDKYSEFCEIFICEKVWKLSHHLLHPALTCLVDIA
jgi:hypothetical protein